MIVFLELTEYETGALVLINFDRVNSIAPSSHPQKPGATLIEFEADDYLFVREPYNEVHDQLRETVARQS